MEAVPFYLPLLELKLFEGRILWEDEKGISRFTLLDVNKPSAVATIHERLDQLSIDVSEISKMVTTELTGPFEAGNFIHQEFCYMSPSEFQQR